MSASLDSTRTSVPTARPQIVDFAKLPALDCPCGTTRRAFGDIADLPLTVHAVEISLNARLHYHRRLTEVYYFLECSPDAQLQLDDQVIAVRAGMSVMIPPGVRHRAIGQMRVLNIVSPKFDPQDEWFD